MIHYECMANCFDISERTTLSCTDNMVGLWWQSKGSAASTSPTSHLLCLQSIHQWFHRYVPRHDFVSGVDNGISDCPSRSQDLTDAALLAHMDASHPQDLLWRLWTPPSELVSEIASPLRCTNYPKGISASRAAAANGHWKKWAKFC